MGLAINIEPNGANVAQIPVGPEPTTETEEQQFIRSVSFVDGRTGINVNVGPFNNEEWAGFLAYLSDPEGESSRQRTREKIAVVHGGPLPKMAIPKG